MTADLIQFPTSEAVLQELAKKDQVEKERRRNQERINDHRLREEERRRQWQSFRDAAPVYTCSVIGSKTNFFVDRPNLFEILPAVFNVTMSWYHHPIGWFVADRRQLPVIPSDSVEVEGV